MPSQKFRSPLRTGPPPGYRRAPRHEVDAVLIERVQGGMKSQSYAPGPLGESEVCLRSFARKLRSLIPEARHDAPPENYA